MDDVAEKTFKQKCQETVDSLLAMPREELLKKLKENENSPIALAMQEIHSRKTIDLLIGLINKTNAMTKEEFQKQEHERGIDKIEFNPSDYVSTDCTDCSLTVEMPKVLPCLRCGTNNVKADSTLLNVGDMYLSFRCQCENGHAWDEWFDSEEEAIAAWNERPQWVYSSATREE